MRVHGLAVTDCEHVVRGFAGHGLFEVGLLSPCDEDVDRGWVEVDAAPTVGGLAARFVEFVSNGDEASRVGVQTTSCPMTAMCWPCCTRASQAWASR